MALDQPPHHRGLARRAEGRADLLGLLDLDQPVDDVAARHQQAMHLLVDAVDLLAQLLRARAERGAVATCESLMEMCLRAATVLSHGSKRRKGGCPR